jgi:hypothetical protein
MIDMPEFAAWRFVDGVDGFEVVYPAPGRLRGHTSAVEDGRPYAVRYEIELDARWHTRRARVWADTPDRTAEILLTSDGDGRWALDGAPASHLGGLIDVDLEASACTNTLPIHRMTFPPGDVVPAAAVYVRSLASRSRGWSRPTGGSTPTASPTPRSRTSRPCWSTTPRG